ncbi:MAG: aldehyde dehydrogenase family protein [Alphaproteobacteria bacterium PRO2]|nr:aldehyde dehydrogenase family protein [Alphaproteobacteria bacterium PRO2]
MVAAVPNYNDFPQIAQETNSKLKEAWGRNNEAYAQAYQDFVNFLRVEMLAAPADPSTFSLTSATNGVFLGKRHLTTDAEVEPILNRARTAHELLSKLPVSFRQGMLNHFLQNSFPKVAAAAAVAQTASMGKAITESKGEITGKGAAWGTWATSETVRNYIEDQSAISKTGYYFANEKGQEITREQIAEAAKTGKPLLVTKYPDNQENYLPGDHVVKGSGISVELPPSNYTALSFPGLTLPVAVGNASITKVSPRVPDPFVILMQGFKHDVRQYLKMHANDLPSDVGAEVNLNKEATVDAIVDGIAQAVSNGGWERYGNSFRLVGGMPACNVLYPSRMESPFISEDDKRRSIYELAGDNPMFIDDVPEDELAAVAGNHLARTASNSGMICTRINAAMVKEGKTYNTYAAILEKKFADYDAAAEKNIGNPHDESTKQGALISEGEYSRVSNYLEEIRQAGARVIGGRRLHQDSGGVYMTPALVILPEDKKYVYEAIRSANVEIFGPVTNLMPVRDVKEAADITNLSTNNLTAAIVSHDADVIDYFVDNTKLGSYNINNPKLGSDNSPFGEHMGHYPGIEYNGPTGGLAHVAHHLNVRPQNPEHAVWISGSVAEQYVEQHLLVLAR